MVSGVVALVIEHKEIMGAVALFVSGVYMLGYSIIHAKSIE